MTSHNDMKIIPNLNAIRLTMVDESMINNHHSVKSTTMPISSPSETSETIQRPLSLISPASTQEHHSTTNSDPSQRQLSILDPLSDRVSTILVWKNLTVLTREDKTTECFQRMKFWNKSLPKRQCLLNNISGAITGGLWAVMGTFTIDFSCVSIR